MRFKKWKNQYIDLVQSLPPELILACEADQFSEQELASLTTRLSAFDHLILDIGCGSGGHVVELASRTPAALHLGIELRFKRAYRAAEKGARAGLNNLYIVRNEARRTLDALPDGSVNGAYVNFPDPWAKRRWEKHRLLNSSFLKLLHGKLKPDGFLSYKTDHSEYFEQTAQLVQELGSFEIVKASTTDSASVVEDHKILTEFERLFRSKGTSVSCLVVKKIAASSLSNI
ncbi:MAG: tRNA (guanosine(46)-N7)-methyltransferase TrmB [Oligoflexia bacterium]|nr:tRNA (guanosine(46)-N7)-methyltransferase TrmB [Oligoflexia bacterium]